MLPNFFISGAFKEDVNNTNLILILKKKKCQTSADFKLIALCNVTYKVEAKILANKIRPLLDDIISPNQAVFVLERQILDNFIVAQELIHLWVGRTREPDYLPLLDSLPLKHTCPRLMIEWSGLSFSRYLI